MKSFLSRSVKTLRFGIKRGGTLLSSKLLGSKSYPIFGIPSGLTQMEEGLSTLFFETEYSLPPPKSFQSYEDPKFTYSDQKVTLKPETVLNVPGGFATATGGVLTPKGKLITTNLVLIDGKTNFKEHDLFYFSTSRFFPKILKTDKPIICMTDLWQDAFYHWMFQILPRLELVDGTKTLFISQNHQFQKESLSLCGYTNIISSSEYDAVYSPQISVPSFFSSPTPRSCAYLRAMFGPKLKKSKKKRLYISREDARTRRVLNEKDVWDLLEKYGYEKTTLTGLPLNEQMELFHSAESIVAPHGAGLSHLVFCDPTTSVIEIFHKNYVNACYWCVSSTIGLDYYHLFDQRESSEIDPDIFVDIEALRKTLDHCHR